MKVKIKRLSDTLTGPPLYATAGSSGVDLSIDTFRKVHTSTGKTNEVVELTPETKSILLLPHSRVLVGCGFAIELPEGYELQIRSRSGNALNKGLIVLNSPGTVDADYRGEIGAIICNTSNYAVNLEVGDKIAQAVLAKTEKIEWEKAEELSTTDRGEGGYGHTGK